MLADFELAGGRSTDLTQLASPRFEEKQALSARQMEDGKLLDDPRLGGDFRPSGQYGRLDLDVENLTGAAYEERSTDRINQRNGYRERRGTRPRVRSPSPPRLRRGSYFRSFVETRHYRPGRAAS
jgi:hypothetical protein